jgi:hypothetical protein
MDASRQPAADTVKNGAQLGPPGWDQNHVRVAALAVLAVGFVARVWVASGTFLNPDEALHFFNANRGSAWLAYQASLTMAHPPLLIFLLYWWKNLGTSEFMLRLPSVLAGTAFCWVFFKWLEKLFGPTVALVGLTFAALLGPMLLLSAEVRQYELLLLFAISGAYLLERALEEHSAGFMLASAACLYLAMLSHYSALLFVAALGVYTLLRLFSTRPPLAVTAVWVAGQVCALALVGFLYVTQLSKLKHTTMAEQAFDSWLNKSYFHPGHGSPIVFALTRSFSVFQFMLGQLVVGDVAALMFVAGIVFLLRGAITHSASGASSRQLAVLLVLPFVVNCAAGLMGVYPYGGTRHCVVLGVFGLTGISLCIVRMARWRAIRALVISLALILLCWAFRSIRQPYFYRADQSHAQMQRALAFIREQIPSSDLILVDYESGLELGHYLCNQQPVSYDGSIPGFLVFTCSEHRIVSTMYTLWAFDPQTFLEQWNHLVADAGLKPDDQVWVAQARWTVSLADDLKRYPELQSLHVQSYGRNIQFFPLKAGQTMPKRVAGTTSLQRAVRE